MVNTTELAKLLENRKVSLAHFNKNDYSPYFAGLMEAAAPVLDTVLPEDASEAAKYLIDTMDSERAALRRVRRSTAMEDDRMFLTVYLVPLLKKLDTPAALSLAEEVTALWNTRHPKTTFLSGTYEDIAAGFGTRIFGFKIN